MERQQQAYLYGLSAVLLWSTVATAFKISLRYLTPEQLLFYAVLTSLIVLALILWVRGQIKQIFTYSRKEYLLSLGLGILNPFLYYIILFKAYDRLPAQEAQPLNYTWAFTLTLLSIPLLKHKISYRDCIGGIICYSGVLVISTRGDLLGLKFSDSWGVGLALGSTIIWALYWVCNTRDRRDPVAALFLNFLIAFPFVALYSWFSSGLSISHYKGLWGAIYVGVFEMGITFIFWLSALKYTSSTSKIASLIFLSPFLSLIFIYFLVGETITGSTLTGLVLIVAGLIFQQQKKTRLEKK